MGDYDEFPGVQVETSGDNLTPGPSGHTFVHIEDFDRSEHVEGGVALHLYAFESEEQRGELLDTANELQQDFISSTCIIWPDEIRDEVEDADTDRMCALEWAYALMPYMEVGAEDLSETADAAERYLSRNE